MTTATQQTPPTPAQRLAAKIRARTNDTRDILDLLHEIAQGEHDATEHDKLNATGILFDRGYGKCPKQAPVLSHVEGSVPVLSHVEGPVLSHVEGSVPVLSPVEACPEQSRRACPEQSRRGPDTGSDPNPAPQTDDNDVEAIPESSPAITHEEPESPRLVTQLDDSLHEALGPPPEADPDSAEARSGGEPALSEAEGPVLSEAEGPVLSEAEGSIQSIIRDHIISITNDGDTLIDVLMDIAWPEDPSTKPFHRQKAGKMLLERGAGKDPTPVLRAIRERPEPSQSVWRHPEYPPDYILDPTKSCIYCSPSLGMKEGHEGDHRRDYEALAKARAEVQRMKDELGIKPDPNRPKIDISSYLPPKDWIPHPDQVRKEAAKFWADIELRLERQKQWPAIEERRRKKLAQIYPSHSDDEPSRSNPPDP